MVNSIDIVRNVVSKCGEFYVGGVYGVSDSLKQCGDEGYRAFFMPELAMVRVDADKDSVLWKKWFLAPSVRVTGNSKKGNSVVVYAHVPTSLSDHVNIRRMIDSNVLVNGAGPMPQDEFYGLLDKEGDGSVFVVDYERLMKSTSDVIRVDDALVHPQVVPFFGGQKIAESYLAKHKDVYGKRIGVWHSDDSNSSGPMGRVLFVGNYDGGLSGNDNLNDYGRVLGVLAAEPQSLENRVDLRQLDSGVVIFDGVGYRRDHV